MQDRTCLLYTSPLADGSGDIVIATTRPETMFGDTGVAVNPEDEKFKHLIVKTCILPMMKDVYKRQSSLMGIGISSVSLPRPYRSRLATR